MKKIETENHVKDLVRQWCDAKGAFHFAVVQNGMGVHGIHDRIAALPITITPAMVGKKIALFVSVESKRPGRRNEKDRGMSKPQVIFWDGVTGASGLSVCCDGQEDLDRLDKQLTDLKEGR